jgi:hypothetical protein
MGKVVWSKYKLASFLQRKSIALSAKDKRRRQRKGRLAMRQEDKDTMYFVLCTILAFIMVATMAFKIGYILGDTDATKECIQRQKK